MGVTTKQTNPDWQKKLMSKLAAIANKEVAVGYPRGKCQAYPDGTSVAEVAYKNTNGIGVPQRDFMAYGKILIERDGTIKDCMAIAAKEATNPKDSSPQVITAMMNAAGQQGVAMIQESILSGEWEPNSQATVDAKGSSHPLIDTSHLKNSVTYVIRDKQR